MITTPLKRKILDTQLPPAACTQEMLDEIKRFAKDQDTSVSSVIRYAVAFFLDENSSKSKEKLEYQSFQSDKVNHG